MSHQEWFRYVGMAFPPAAGISAKQKMYRFKRLSLETLVKTASRTPGPGFHG